MTVDADLTPAPVDLDLAGEPINPTSAGARDLRQYIPDAAESAWDRVAFNGTVFSGVAAVKCKRTRRDKSRATPGRRGARHVDTGSQLAEVSITLTVWINGDASGANQFNDLFTLINNVLMPSERGGPGSAAAAVAIEHPATRYQSVEAIYVEEIDGPEPGQAQGSLVCTIRAKEFVPEAQRRSPGTRTPKLDRPVDAVVLPRSTLDQHARTAVAGRPPSKTNTGP